MIEGIPSMPPEQAEETRNDESFRATVEARLVRERTVERLQQIALSNHVSGVSEDDEADESTEDDAVDELPDAETEVEEGDE